MTLDDLVSLRFYLAEAADDPANVAILRAHLGEHRAARTVICAKLLEPSWLIEVEAVAAHSAQRPEGDQPASGWENRR
jgi:2-iminobutanoate/2-iminopropanoate deaminase